MKDEIKITFRLIFEKGNWDLFCREKGYNFYMFNEGRTFDEAVVKLTIDELRRYMNL